MRGMDILVVAYIETNVTTSPEYVTNSCLTKRYSMTSGFLVIGHSWNTDTDLGITPLRQPRAIETYAGCLPSIYIINT